MNLLPVLVVDKTQSLKGQQRIVMLDQVCLVIDQLAKAAGCNGNKVLITGFLDYLTNDVLGLSDTAVNNARLHTADGLFG